MTYDDPLFTDNWQHMEEENLVRGAYHYAWPQSDRSGDAEADHMLSVLERNDSGTHDLAPVLVLQWRECPLAPDALHAWIGEFVVEVEHRASRKPIIYTGRFWKDRLGARSSFGCPLWIADYSERPQPPPAWDGWTFWQRTAAARAAGVTGKVDADLYPGTLEQLLQLCGDRQSKEAGQTAPLGPTPVAAYQGFPLRQGIAGPEVRTWQRRMTERAWPIAVDAVYGPQSTEACERFQRLHGLNADGVVGLETWTATFATS
jgi:hypothetical protein